MGTRGLLGLIIKGKRHGAYNHFDSYPSGLGSEIAKFILSLTPEEWDEMAKLVEGITWVKEGEKPSKELQERYSSLGFADLQVSNRALEDWYCLLRKVQFDKTLPAIKSGNLKHLVESIDFLKDGLFCEWAYFIDFENKTLETFKNGKAIEQVSFEKLGEAGGEEYMTLLEKRLRREENGEGDEDEDTSRDS
ncbi:hypothetical protein G7Y89_g2648 [Cudoniella acicularis]|uniref:Uncharacterized protein n=1 Tax=Cudoniella acicularis TaxID=354080 RepID=A0A8H4RVX3_9HELO|nr:hypothetical protein G7Y89_g2648 [Cudoniella acicularis]